MVDGQEVLQPLQYEFKFAGKTREWGIQRD